MDWSKTQVEKLLFFVAGVVPGFIALLIYHLAVPGSFAWFFTLGFLGYKTKLALILITAFIIGNCMTTFLWAILGMVGGAFGSVIARRPFQPSHTETVAPWRDVRWRIRLRNRLGAQAPNNTRLIPEELLTLRRQMIDNLPLNERPQAHAALNIEKINTEMDDAMWSQWYEHYHQIVVTREIPDIRWYVRRGLNINLQTAGLYVLLSVMFVPGLRHWWCIVPACMWVLLLVAEEYSSVQRLLNKWSTLDEQIRYLSEG